MLMKCEGGEGNQECEFCSQTRQESVKLFKKIIHHLDGKHLNKSQAVQSVIMAALSAIELIAENDKTEAAQLVVVMIAEWVDLIEKSQTVDLKNKHNVANIMEANSTLN